MIIKNITEHFKARRLTEKSNFINNVHKAFDAYRHVDENYETLNISVVFTNIELFFNKLTEKYSPTATRNYIRHINESIEQPIIQNNVDSVILVTSKILLAKLIKKADKNANTYEKKTKQVIVIPDDDESHIDINDVIPNDTPDSPSRYTSSNTTRVSTDGNIDITRLTIENEFLKDEIKWLRKIIEKFAEKS